ncbi:MAG: hypothetical protein KF752_19395 [Pirellulaceae bacterium]|nr:hypothetical protein [Pirellulaceae bacterium]
MRGASWRCGWSTEITRPGLWWFRRVGLLRSYRFLPVFFRNSTRTTIAPTPSAKQAIIGAWLKHKYARQLRYGSRRSFALNHITIACACDAADMTPERVRDRHIEFFARRNPGHTSGDELCCLARLARDNFTRAAHHVYPINGPAEPSELAASSVAASRSRQNAASK